VALFILSINRYIVVYLIDQVYTGLIVAKFGQAFLALLFVFEQHFHFKMFTIVCVFFVSVRCRKISLYILVSFSLSDSKVWTEIVLK